MTHINDKIRELVYISNVLFFSNKPKMKFNRTRGWKGRSYERDRCGGVGRIVRYYGRHQQQEALP
jgi:hypothetical protein